MNFSAEDIKKIAHLARIQVSEQDTASLSKDLTNILNMVEQMSKADTSAVQPMAHPLDETQPLRNDAVSEEDQRELFQTIAPNTQHGLYIVPPVIDSE